MKVVIIDNYDSFTFNLYQYCGEILNKTTLSGQSEIIVKRNNEITVEDLENLNPASEAARIGATVGGRKREQIHLKADE